MTDISGRGVGMDVVKNNIEKIGGSVDVVSEVLASGVEHHRQMIGPHIAHQLHQHGAKAIDGIDRHAVGLGHGWKAVKGPEDIARAVDQIEMAERVQRSVNGRKRPQRLPSSNRPSDRFLCPARWPRA